MYNLRCAEEVSASFLGHVWRGDECLSYQGVSGHSHVFQMCCFSHSPVPCLLHHLLPYPTPLNSSWTEDTRSSIFSDTALHLGKDGQRPLAAELDMQIEQKFKEFDELLVTGRNLLDKEHHLTQMVSRVTDWTEEWLTVFLKCILSLVFFSFLQTLSHVLQVKERMEELRSMLGWILVHWRAQKQQWLHKKSRQNRSDNIYSEATMCSLSSEVNEQKESLLMGQT